MKVTQDKLLEYREIQEQMKELRRTEMEMRIQICDALKMDKLGVNNYFIDGLKVKATKKVNYNIDKEQLENLYDDFTEEERQAIRFKPDLNISNFKNLNHDEELLIDECITISPATPSLEIIVPGE